MKRELRFVFRCDASPAMGGGHVMRCLTLADELARRRHTVQFLVTARTLETVPRLGSSSHRAQVIHAAQPTARDYAGADVVLFDHYDLDASDHAPAREAGASVAAIDDLADRPHDCDLLVDTTYGRDAIDYAPLVPATCRVLAGAQFALLRPEFAALRTSSLERRRSLERPERVLVSLGLTDVGGVTARAVDAVVGAPGLRHIDVLVGAGAQSLDALSTLASKDARVTVEVDASDVAERMADADLAVGAGGTTTWERCCLGLPTVLLVLADNQAGVAQRLAAAGAAVVAEEAEVRDLVCDIAADARELQSLSAKAATLCDGQGSARVADALESLVRCT